LGDSEDKGNTNQIKLLNFYKAGRIVPALATTTAVVAGL